MVGPKGRPIRPSLLLEQTPSRNITPKKRQQPSSNLDDSVRSLLRIKNTHVAGSRKLLIRPIITTKGRKDKLLYLSHLHYEFQATKVSLTTQVNQTVEGLNQLCWEQLRCDIQIHINPSCRDLTSTNWDQCEWIKKWQPRRKRVEDGSFIWHALAIMYIEVDGDVFF